MAAAGAPTVAGTVDDDLAIGVTADGRRIGADVHRSAVVSWRVAQVA